VLEVTENDYEELEFEDKVTEMKFGNIMKMKPMKMKSEKKGKNKGKKLPVMKDLVDSEDEEEDQSKNPDKIDSDDEEDVFKEELFKDVKFRKIFRNQKRNENEIELKNKSECVDCEVEFSRQLSGSRDKELNNVENVNGGARLMRKGKVTVDSGAEDSVWPASRVRWDKVVDSEDSLKGIGFVAANGEKMTNYGSTQVEFAKDGKTRRMNFAVTDCKKPLASVSKIVEKGNRVVFDELGSYILNKATGEKIALEKERGTYVMVVEFEVETPKATNPDSGFRRRA